jgi:hypothetical protein
MRPAREVAHAHEAYYEDCPGPLPSSTGHAPSCNRLTAAIEARDREAVETTTEDVLAAVARCGGRFLIDEIRDDLAGPDSVRSLAPLPGGTK